jgi:hypothetical protein
MPTGTTSNSSASHASAVLRRKKRLRIAVLRKKKRLRNVRR